MVISPQRNALLEQCRIDARNYLALKMRERQASDWFVRIQSSPDARGFFRRSVLSKGAVLQASAVAAVARAFLLCADEDFAIAPKKSEVDSIRSRAAALKSELDKAAPWWLIPDARSEEFRVPLVKLELIS
ncbi:hypothetical protein [Herbaspirillum sp. C7C8]|uniref:hypothetical protein n=1 Tax=Herbaspirillum sp. C7C8 TaxID=2736665 RepID=UPI001F52498B|nr:hypothetical protein [Herbaspirillum sp. C7C8]MCI1006999.1 hypothetical protein [Herbaspirillum sp. C7C8]